MGKKEKPDQYKETVVVDYQLIEAEQATFMVSGMIDDYLLMHPTITRNKDWKKLAAHARASLEQLLFEMFEVSKSFREGFHG